MTIKELIQELNNLKQKVWNHPSSYTTSSDNDALDNAFWDCDLYSNTHKGFPMDAGHICDYSHCFSYKPHDSPEGNLMDDHKSESDPLYVLGFNISRRATGQDIIDWVEEAHEEADSVFLFY